MKQLNQIRAEEIWKTTQESVSQVLNCEVWAVYGEKDLFLDLDIFFIYDKYVKFSFWCQSNIISAAVKH